MDDRNEMDVLDREQRNDLAPAAGPINPFGGARAPVASNAAAETDQTRAIAETQAAMVIAKRFPRDQIAAMDRILQAFTRPTLAESAMYSYSRGGSEITGPSIRAAETLAQCWGNIQFGVRELEQRNGESTVEAFAWDIETNAKQVKVFQVPHIRHTRTKTYKLEDPRDIYELVANQGARRLRACILGVIPGDVTEAAIRQAETTLKTRIEVTPDLIKSLLAKFAEFGVTQPSIEKRIQRRMEAITPALVVQLGKIYNSLKDGMSNPAEWFEAAPESEPKTETPARGSAGLKAAAAAKVKAATDNGFSEKPKGFSYVEVADAIKAAESPEAIDAAKAMIAGVPDEAQRAELDVEERAKRKAINAAIDKAAK